jgi:hypothetical protein
MYILAMGKTLKIIPLTFEYVLKSNKGDIRHYTLNPGDIVPIAGGL